MFTLNQIVQKYSPQDVQSFINDFMNQNNPRYDSFDYCYGFFQTNQRNLTKNMEQSCMALWSYLASWGMLRGSSMLLQKGNYKALEDTITVIQRYFNNPQSLPNIENDSQNDYVMKVVNLCGDIENSFTYNRMQKYHSTNTLITKIVLGVFGVFPALDQYFCKTFGGGTSRRGFAEVVWLFYNEPTYKRVVQNHLIQVKSFNGQPTRLIYPIAKMIDMFGFSLGGMVQGEKNEIMIHNGAGRTVCIDKQQPIKINQCSIQVSPGTYRVEVFFQNNQSLVWDKVTVTK